MPSESGIPDLADAPAPRSQIGSGWPFSSEYRCSIELMRGSNFAFKQIVPRTGDRGYSSVYYNTVDCTMRVRSTFSAGEASNLTGVPYRTLDHWARTRFIVPSGREAHGTGSERRYTFADLIALRTARELRSSGMSTQALRRVVQFLRRNGTPDPLSELRLLVRGRDILVAEGAAELTSVLSQPGQGVFAFVFDLTQTVRELREAAARLRAA